MVYPGTANVPFTLFLYLFIYETCIITPLITCLNKGYFWLYSYNLHLHWLHSFRNLRICQPNNTTDWSESHKFRMKECGLANGWNGKKSPSHVFIKADHSTVQTIPNGCPYWILCLKTIAYLCVFQLACVCSCRSSLLLSPWELNCWFSPRPPGAQKIC